MPKTGTPTPPSYLPKAKQKEWLKLYDEAFKIESKNSEDQATVRQAALKRANELLRVPEPKSADDIAKLEEHQVLKRETKLIDGVEHLVCVTADGGKYRFPVKKQGAKADTGAGA